MRVLHVYRTYFPDTQGGLEETIRQICRNCQPLGIKSRVLSLTPEHKASVVRFDEADVYRYPISVDIRSCGMSVKALTGFRSLSGWADIVHYHYPWPFADMLHFSSRITNPTVVTYHSDIIRQRLLRTFYEPLKWQFLRKVNKIVATSENYFSSSATLARLSEKVEIIPIGLDEKSYPVPTQSRIEVMRNNVGEGFFLFIGVLRSYKGLGILLEAMRETDLKLVIAGSGPIQGKLKQQATEQHLSNVQFMGQISDEDKMALIKLSCAVVLPSNLRSEAFGVSLVEASMYGKPLICTEIGTGTSFVNIHNETGLIVAPNDPTALHNAMETLNEDKTLAMRLGRGARNRYEALFTGKRMGRKYADLYRHISKLS